MRYHVLACDYDGTLATDGHVDDATAAALERCIESGRKLVLVTGRRLDELLTVFHRPELFQWIVAENGALVYRPSTREEVVLGQPPPAEFIDALANAGVCPCDAGRVILATWRPHEETVLKTIVRFGLELQVIFNKGAVMVLPSGVNKATGLMAALGQMGVSAHNVVAIGDGENDHALLQACEAATAVANSVPMLREQADLVTRADHGAGVRELIDQLVGDDLAGLEPRLVRHHLLLGHRDDGSEVRLPPYGLNLLVGGTSGGGKSTLATALLEQLLKHRYQFCVIDPEGDYEDFEGAVTIGSGEQPPQLETVFQLLSKPDQNVVVDMLGVPWKDRPAQFVQFLTRVQQMRSRLGRPHWIVIDEAHHVLPAESAAGDLVIPERLDQTLLITTEPNLVNPLALSKIDQVIALGKDPEETLRIYSEAVAVPMPELPTTDLEKGELILWPRTAGKAPLKVTLAPGSSQRRRHRRKYAEGQLEPNRSFYFRGPDDKLNLRAQNLVVFLQMAEGVDDQTWRHHLLQGDYSRWFRDGVKDPELAEEVAEVESQTELSPEESRERIRHAIERRYTLPAMATADRPAAHRSDSL